MTMNNFKIADQKLLLIFNVWGLGSTKYISRTSSRLDLEDHDMRKRGKTFSLLDNSVTIQIFFASLPTYLDVT